MLSEKSLMFIEKAKKVHGDKYDYSLVEYKNNKTKVKIICKEHGVFEQRPDSHLFLHQGCPWCAGNIVNKEIFISNSKKVHGDKYDYSLVNYKNNRTKVKIICKEHDIFEQTPLDHLDKCGCPKCAGKYKTTESIINEFKNIYEDKYDYNKTKFEKVNKKIIIICKEHGEFKMLYNDHVNGHGCPNCSNTKRLTNEMFIEKAKKVHGDRYDYSLVEYINNRSKIKIICKEHSVFEQSPNSHLQGSNCPRCKESRGESIISIILSELSILYVKEYRLERGSYSLEADFYLPKYDIIIEYNGEQHYKPNTYFGGEKEFLKNIERDERKKKICEERNIKLLIIPYTINKKEDIEKEIITFLKKERSEIFSDLPNIV